MALQDILKKIKQQTEEQLNKLAKQFEERKKELEDENNSKMEEINKKMNQKVEENKEKIIKKTETLVEREAKNQLLTEKHRIIEEALEEAIENICKTEDYEEILAEMLSQVNVKDENTVIVPAKGKEEETKNAIKKAGKNFFVSDTPGKFKGGFVVKTDTLEINNSFETIIGTQLKAEIEIKLHQLLFT